ncbi:response regulator [Pseudomonas aeruginosa]|nr:response regulator [Pseudomonas aeruginosa]
MNQTVIEAMLRSLGYRVTLVADGIQAVRSAERQRYDAIPMDCRLPVLDGYSATREIRAQENGRQVPIIALTANAPAGRSGELPAGGNERLPGQAIQTGGIATHTATLDRLAAGTPRDIERNRTRGAGVIYDKGGKRTRE